MSPEAGTGRKPARGDLLECELAEIDERGRSLGRCREFTVAVRGGTVGARVRAQVARRRGNALEARLAEELVPSPHSTAPRCRHVASCGGCSFQELAYAAQLAAKGRLLVRTLEPLGSPCIESLCIEPVLGCDPPWRYRNKMDFTFGRARWIEPGEPEQAENGFALGLHARGNFHKVLDLHACELAFEGAVPIVASVREAARALGLAPWDVRARAGLLRHLVLRRSWHSGEILADLVTTEEAAELVRPLVETVLARHAEITTFVQHVQPGVALVASGRLARVFRGSGTILERVDGLDFSISAQGFFQTNTPQAERLVQLVREWADVRAGDQVFDLYCGGGLFTLALARAAGAANVTGFELAESALADARANAARNGLTDVHFVAGDLALTLAPEALARQDLFPPSVCVVDPPRAGLHDRVVAALIRLAPARIVYVSCNPRSAVRDLGALLAQGYSLERAQPVDLFPHTPHVECVFRLVRAG